MTQEEKILSKDTAGMNQQQLDEWQGREVAPYLKYLQITRQTGQIGQFLTKLKAKLNK